MKKAEIESFGKLDSNSEEIKVWPEYILDRGQYMTHVRIFQHKKYWLVVVRVGLDTGKNSLLASVFDSFNMWAYRTLINYIVSPEYKLANNRNGRPIACALDINQESETDRIIPKA